MSDRKERSGIFKFFYVILSIISFPIFMILFILRHPLWIIFLLLLIAGGAVYYPMSQGVKTEDLLTWYQDKFVDVQKDVVAKAEEKGMKDFVPKSVVDNVKKIEEEEKEALLPKGENYNRNIDRDEKAEETRAKLKKRGGFKKQKKAEDTEENALSEDENTEVQVLEKSGQQVGGLSAFLKSDEVETNEENAVHEEQTLEENSEETENNDEIKEPEVKEEAPVQEEVSIVKEIPEVQNKEPLVEEQGVSDESANVSLQPQKAEEAEVNKKEDEVDLDFF